MNWQLKFQLCEKPSPPRSPCYGLFVSPQIVSTGVPRRLEALAVAEKQEAAVAAQAEQLPDDLGPCPGEETAPVPVLTAEEGASFRAGFSTARLLQHFSFKCHSQIQAQNLGMAMEAWNEEGIWAHGDCRINPKTGGVIMLGWSDGTLNPSGVRFGSMEIYNVVDSFKEVEHSLCVPQYNKYGEERVILFLKMASGHAFQPDLVKRIHDTIHVGLSVRHVPSLIVETKGIPYTLNGKKVEVAVKQIIAGKAVEQRGAFLNPEALQDIPELQGF
ncbi:PREDICTED: acetoacetyl-CoA synthetase-like [Colobus angolensis palliatus]|uniref:acetoacetyl-CoA synthetase-like n=1 Tax=Colobus angolensis palliatus TaxID=336983 RepID=UPI0005F41346|nr:PREDICTED: acetoacetyl-CoA synthetase-like [Colobus angolensis palliatus]